MGSMGRPSRSQASHGARPTYSAPKATGHREATWWRILFGAQSDPAALRGHAATCFVCGHFLTSP